MNLRYISQQITLSEEIIFMSSWLVGLTVRLMVLRGLQMNLNEYPITLSSV